jgi:hypothetical protein
MREVASQVVEDWVKNHHDEVNHLHPLIDAISAALTKAIADERRESDEDFLKLVQQLAAMNTSVPNLVAAIEEDIGYGAHRVDRDRKREQAQVEQEKL